MDILLMIGGAIIVVIGVVFVAWLAMAYNFLVLLRNKIDNSWAQIDVQMKLRYDLVPNLVETVKGYAKHEKGVFEAVTKARAATAQAKGPAAMAKASGMLTEALKSLFAVVENYPELKANLGFLELQQKLADIESKIAYARQIYNDEVYKLNLAVQQIPTNFVAGIFGFREREYFKAEGAERDSVKVKF